MQKFLTAKWQDLILANYEVEPQSLMDFVPAGTELDLNDGKCFVSLVAFMFRETRVLGISIPFHINFEEINLRFYVTRKAGSGVRRGVVFVKEIVPRFAIALVARRLYGEPYETWNTGHSIIGNKFSYSFTNRAVSNSIAVTAEKNLGIPTDDSHGSFIIEHYWGYTRRSLSRTDEYKVEHPKWEVFSVSDHNIDVDFGATYGERFAFLNNERPYSVIFATGSEIAVYKGKSIK